jgi:hypothetical protein
MAHVRLSRETGGRKWVSWLGAVACLAALGVTFYDFLITPAARLSAVGMVAIVLISVACEQAYRIFWLRQPRAWGGAALTASAMAAMALAPIRPAAPPVPVVAPAPLTPMVEPVAERDALPAAAPATEAVDPAKSRPQHPAPASGRRKHGKRKG